VHRVTNAWGTIERAEMPDLFDCYEQLVEQQLKDGTVAA
jgi:hypothetical protein